MQTIGIFSDTHGHIPPALWRFFEPCDEIWHAGDWGSISCYNEAKNFKPIKGVWGNIDGQEIRILMPEVNIFHTEGLKVCMLHIGGYPGKYSPKFKEILTKEKPDLMVCGHSHILKVINDPINNLLHINPGAAGKSGFHKVSTAVRLVIDNGKPKNLEVWEAKK